jgi:UDP:flavonoid glycosyltransferase YjiC (YdhE family)
MKHALLFGVGSAGDVFPFIALGKGLAANGWQVSLCANPTFEQQVLRAGLAFEPLGTREHYDRITLNPNLWHPRKGTRTILADFQAMDMVRNQRDLARQFAKGPGNRVLISSSLGFGARIAQEETGVPLVTTHLAPIVLRCPKNPPRVPGGWLPNTLLRFAPKMAYRLVDSIADPLIGGAVEPLRAESGNQPIKRYLQGWWNSPDRVLLNFPEWFGPMAQLPPQARHVGFLQHDDDEQADDNLLRLWRFVEAGTPPIVASFGSAMRQARWLLERMVQASADAGARLVILSKDPQQVPKPLPPHAFHATWAPMGKLLPQAAMLTHHGGIGTLARALSAGIPQLVIPFAHDQADNAHRVRWLGCGDFITPPWATRHRLAKIMTRLLDEKNIQATAHNLSQRINPQTSLQLACDLVEQAAMAKG